jgi:hypothetical protein
MGNFRMIRQLVLPILFFTFPLLAGEGVSPQAEMLMESPVPTKSLMGKGMEGVMREALLAVGYRLRVTYFPSRRGLEELRLQRIDGTVGRIGNLPKMLDAPHLVQIQVPVLHLNVTRWCRKNIQPNPKTILVGSRLGSVIAMTLVPFMAPGLVELVEIRDQKSSVQMMLKGRLDCLISNDNVLATEGVKKEELEPFDRFDIVTVEVMPWIDRRHEHLKPKIEKAMRAHVYPQEFEEQFRNLKPVCHNQFNRVCPDGLLFTKGIRLDL